MRRNGTPAILPLRPTRTLPVRPRCHRCAGRLYHCQGETYCPACTGFTLATAEPAEPPAAPTWYEARTVDGSHVHTGPDLDALIAWVRDVVAAEDDVIISAGPRVVAIVQGDGGVVQVR
jgi:hypothetical protein